MKPLRISLGAITLIAVAVWASPLLCGVVGPSPYYIYVGGSSISFGNDAVMHEYWMAWVQQGMPRVFLHQADHGDIYPTIWANHGGTGAITLHFAAIAVAAAASWFASAMWESRSRRGTEEHVDH